MAKLTAIAGDVFAGMFTLGVTEAGFEVPVHLEHGDYGVKTALMNFPHLDIRYGVENWNVGQLAKLKPDLFFTNPPCAPWSTASAGREVPWDKDPRLSCVTTLVDAAIKMKPKAFLWESVCQAWGKGQDFVKSQAERLMAEGYHVTVILQNNKLLGAPQDRKRMFLIAHLHPLVWPRFWNPKTVNEVLKTVKGDKEKVPHEVGNLNEILWKKSPAHHGNFAATYARTLTTEDKKRPGGKPGFLYQRLVGTKPAPVYFASLCWHPDKPRHLTYRESLALCGLPPTWQCENMGIGAVSGFISRGVLPDVGKWMALSVKDGLELPKLKGKPKFHFIDMRRGDLTAQEVLL